MTINRIEIKHEYNTILFSDRFFFFLDLMTIFGKKVMNNGKKANIYCVHFSL